MQFKSVKIFTAPEEKISALAVAKTVGNSITISAPALTAWVALVNLSITAFSPRWVKLPLIITSSLSHPEFALANSINFICPL